MANIYDIARLAGVSIATVSKVINDRPDVSEKTKIRVRKIMEEENFIPNSVARSLSLNQSKSIGILFNSSHEFGLHNLFFQEVLFGVEKTLGNAGYDYVYFADQKWHNLGNYDYLGKCKDRMVDGAILLGIHPDDSMKRLLESDLPVVLIDYLYTNETTTYVTSNNEYGGRRAAEYLHELGHRDVGMITGFVSVPAEQRSNGFMAGVKDFNLNCKEEWIVDASFYEGGGYNAMKKILSMDKWPSAIFCHSDAIAIGAIKAIKEAGLRVPEDFSTIGFDNIEICKYITPALTTIKQDSYRIGELAARQLLSMLNSPYIKLEPIVLDTELIIRESCMEFKGA